MSKHKMTNENNQVEKKKIDERTQSSEKNEYVNEKNAIETKK